MRKKHLFSKEDIMKFLLNTGWMKSLISKAITFGVTKKAGIKADLSINDLAITDDEEGVMLHLDMNVRMSREELERLVKELM
jgi:hypothetical protein